LRKQCIKVTIFVCGTVIAFSFHAIIVQMIISKSLKIEFHYPLTLFLNFHVAIEIIYVLPLILATRTLENRFKILNNLLKNSFLNAEVTQVLPRESRKILIVILRLFNELSDGLDLTNQIFTFSVNFIKIFVITFIDWFEFQFILYSGTCLMTNVIIYYSFIQDFIKNGNRLLIIQVINSFPFIIYAVSIEVYTIKSAVECVNQIKATAVLVNKMETLYYDSDFIDILNIFARQISNRKRTITSVFFEIDWTLLYSVCLILQHGQLELKFHKFILISDHKLNYCFSYHYLSSCWLCWSLTLPHFASNITINFEISLPIVNISQIKIFDFLLY
jgi:hypothetical protein